MASMADDDDAFFASIDVDAIIEQSKKSSQSSQSSPPTVAKARGNDGFGEAHGAFGMVKNRSPQGAPPQAKLPFGPLAEEKDLKRTLSEVFGYDDFRHEQLPVIQAALQGRDVSVLWATGCGKSLCYQIPAFHRNATVLVVSPLISLMNDQVIAINNKAPATGGLPPATFLGSANVNAGDEAAALRGDFRLVYVTPEKLAGSSGFLQALRPLAESGKLALVAIDEAHCVSQWGPDFRPSYFELGAIRKTLPSVPIMALTATAVPAVRQDIADVLQLSTPLWSITSFDRPNLAISVVRKRNMNTDLERLLGQLRQGASGSTIVYVPTTAETENVAGFLRQRLEGKVDVRYYHGKMSLSDRSQTHRDFLSGAVDVVVATVAFGMGIDKPDIRQVVHYGAPKTFEEYYQQVGRAGRDGLPSTCELICSDSDFANYGSDFYVGSLTPEARRAVEASTAALRKFANDRGSCRRRAILAHFKETPPWEQCGTCDVCRSSMDGTVKAKRDFRAEAALLLQAVAACATKPPATTGLLQLVGDGATKTNVGVEMRKRLQDMRKALPSISQKQEVLKDILIELHEANLLRRKRVQSMGGPYSWEVHEITPAGEKQLRDNAPLLMSVPPQIQAAEEAKQKRLQEQMEELKQAGIQPDRIPKEEIEAGHGQVMSTHLMWSRTVQRHRDNGRMEAVELMEGLLECIFQWRNQKARQLSMAPANVLQDHVAKRLAYAKVTSVDAMREAGVRIRGVEELAEVVAAYLQEHGVGQETAGGESPRESGGELVLPGGEFKPASPWKLAVYKPLKNGKKPAWEVAYQRFMNKEHIQAIAMNQESGRPIQAASVLGYVLEGLLQGRAVDLQRAAEESQSRPPNSQEWRALDEAALATGTDVVRDERYSQKELLLAATGRPDKDAAEKSEQEKEEDRVWYGKIRWWHSLKRVGFEPQFEGEAGHAKRQRAQ